jgi:hypothetical protein
MQQHAEYVTSQKEFENALRTYRKKMEVLIRQFALERNAPAWIPS